MLKNATVHRQHRNLKGPNVRGSIALQPAPQYRTGARHGQQLADRKTRVWVVR